MTYLVQDETVTSSSPEQDRLGGLANRSFVIGGTVEVYFQVFEDDVYWAGSTPVVTIEAPSGADTTPTVSSEGSGVYSVSFTPSQAGYHRVKIYVTGSFVRERTFYVASSSIV